MSSVYKWRSRPRWKQASSSVLAYELFITYPQDQHRKLKKAFRNLFEKRYSKGIKYKRSVLTEQSRDFRSRCVQTCMGCILATVSSSTKQGNQEQKSNKLVIGLATHDKK